MRGSVWRAPDRYLSLSGDEGGLRMSREAGSRGIAVAGWWGWVTWQPSGHGGLPEPVQDLGTSKSPRLCAQAPASSLCEKQVCPS